jgi:hypothetical protein
MFGRSAVRIFIRDVECYYGGSKVASLNSELHKKTAQENVKASQVKSRNVVAEMICAYVIRVIHQNKMTVGTQLPFLVPDYRAEVLCVKMSSFLRLRLS